MKNLLKKLRIKNWQGVAILIFAALLLATPTTSSAQGASLLDCVKNPATCAIYTITLVLTSFGSFFITIGAWLTGVALSINRTILISPTVTIGFDFVLNIANLGLVLGLILIAIATIIRQQTHGAKQLLFRLIAMAILVNFSLVIAGSLITLSDQISDYILVQMDPTNQGDGVFSDQVFVLQLTRAFSPQELFDNSASQTDVEGEGWGSFFGKLQTVGRLTSGPPGIVAESIRLGISALRDNNNVDGMDGFIKAVLNMFFVVIFSFLFAFTLIAIAVMFTLRYVWLTVLLIWMPLAWLAFVFPASRGQFKQWWSKFLRWVFFAPIMLFTLYLALYIALNRTDQQYLAEHASIATEEAASVAALVDNNIGIVQHAAEMWVVLFLAWSGLLTANQMGIGVAGTAMNMAKSTGKWAQGAVSSRAKRMGKEYVGSRLRTAGRDTDEKTGKTTTWAQRFGSRLQGIPGLNTVGQVFSRAGTEQGANLMPQIEEFRKQNLESLTDEGLVNFGKSKFTELNPVQMAAVADEATRRNKLTEFDKNQRAALVYAQTRYANGGEEMFSPERMKDSSKEQLKALSEETIVQKLDAKQMTNLTAELARRDMLRKSSSAWADPKLIKTMVRFSSSLNKAQSLFNNMPELVKHALKPGETEAEGIARVVKKIPLSDAANISTESLSNKDVLLNLGKGQISRIGAEGNRDKTDAVINKVKDLYKNGWEFPSQNEQDYKDHETLMTIRSFIMENPNWMVSESKIT